MKKEKEKNESNNKRYGCEKCQQGQALEIHEKCRKCGLVNELSYLQQQEERKKRNTFIDDDEKMEDFVILTKEDFLKSYSYLTEEEYNNTEEKYNNQDYEDDYDENPIIEEDVRNVLNEFNLNNAHPLEVDFWVDRHVLGDGKHKVVFSEDNFSVNVDGWTTRKKFKEDLRNELKRLQGKN